VIPAVTTPLRRALIVLGAIGIAMGILMVVVIATSDHMDDRAILASLSLLVAWSFLGTGLYAWDRRPENLIGPLMVCVAFGWYLAQLVASDIPALFALGMIANSVPYAFIVHLLVVFPDGRIRSPFERFIVVYGYVASCVVAAFPVVFLDTLHASDQECRDCPANPLLIADRVDLANAIYAVLSLVSAIVLTTLIAHFVRRARAAEPSERQRDAPVWWAGGATLFLFAASLLTNLGPEAGSYDDVLYYVSLVGISSVPYAFLLGLLRSRLSDAEVVAQENLRLDSELQARLDELRESRARIVQEGDSARRKLERDLHDGAQQRLVGLALDLRMARSRLAEQPEEAARILDEAQAELARATDELRELARGIHPAVLSDRGLAAAVDALAVRAPLPVEVEAELDGRLPEPVEAAAYFVVAEALTNVARHSEADHAEVGILRTSGRLQVEVRDDGRGGADLRGSGLRGLADRLSALDGSLVVFSEPGKGTLVRASIPMGGA
jgi:signal transduction histidine kinase